MHFSILSCFHGGKQRKAAWGRRRPKPQIFRDDSKAAGYSRGAPRSLISVVNGEWEN